MSRAGGSLTVVGSGIRPQHLTGETAAAIESADELLYLAAESVTAAWLATLHPCATSLAPLYVEGVDRAVTYEAMANSILAPARRGAAVAAAFYGHPGVFVAPSHEAVARARAEGIPARMLPAVSAEDCLFADLGIDPGRSGCQTYGASYYLAHRPPLDTRAHVLLWQISVVGERRAVAEVPREGLRALTDALGEHYAPAHEVVVYEASPYTVVDASVARLPLRELPEHDVTAMATLVIPPA